MLIFTGDINLTDWIFNVGFDIGTNIEKGLNPFKYLDRKEDDLWIGNFEGVVSSVSTNKGIYARAFRVEPNVLKNLQHMDIYGFANNHAMEHGVEAYKESVEILESFGSRVFGMRDCKSILFNHKGQKFSISGMCLRIEATKEAPLYWHNPEYGEIEAELASLPKDAFKILYVHWGNEYINRPSAAQKKFAHWLIDAGFDLIIGMHPHVLQGYEKYNGKYIFYSLGNFVFEMAWLPTTIGAIVKFDLETEQPTVEYIKIEKDCTPIVVDESEIPTEWRFSYLNDILKKDDNSEQYHAEISRNYAIYRRANHRYIINNMIKHPTLGVSLMKDFFKRRFLK